MRGTPGRRCCRPASTRARMRTRMHTSVREECCPRRGETRRAAKRGPTRIVRARRGSHALYHHEEGASSQQLARSLGGERVQTACVRPPCIESASRLDLIASAVVLRCGPANGGAEMLPERHVNGVRPSAARHPLTVRVAQLRLPYGGESACGEHMCRSAAVTRARRRWACRRRRPATDRPTAKSHMKIKVEPR